MAKLPKLLSIRQAAEATGLSRFAIWYAISHGRISDTQCQKVDGRWVLTEDFRIREPGVQNDPFLNALPPSITSVELDKDIGKVTEKPHKSNSNPTGNTRQLKLPGYERETEGMSTQEVYRLTKVHFLTQKRIKEGRPVRASVALRLAKGLNIPVERLLK